jgi:crotonobetainyl-CoA:carnitine CoA-transferase CaiB-like acyl-CoA transferase
MQEPPDGAKPLEGLKVIDAASLFAAPFAATLLADFGAEVVKVEMPGPGDPLRAMGSTKGGTSLWWKVYARNKQTITLDLRTPKGQQVMRELVRDADVLVENFRPGTMEGWNLGWEQLRLLNPRLVMLRVSGYGRVGPYSSKPGFGTLCEGMSGFAVLNGDPAGPPTVAPMAVGDCIAGLYGAVGVLVALLARAHGRSEGQTVDVSLLDALFGIIGYQVVEYDQLGLVMQRTGNRSSSSVPRNIYRTRDNRWITVSSSTNALALRVLQMMGGEALACDERFSTPQARSLHADELDALVAAWVARRDLADAMAEFEKHDGAAVPAYDIAQIFEEPHFRASGTLIRVEDDELGAVHMPCVVPRLSATPGAVRFAGRPLSADTREVLRNRTTLSESQILELEGLGIL